VRDLKIGVNGRMLQERMSGIPRVVLALVEGLAEPRTGCELHVFLLKRPFLEPEIQRRLAANPRIMLHVSPWRGRTYLSRALWDFFVLGLEVRKHQFGVLFGPAFSVPRFAPCPTAVLIYDLVLQRAPPVSRDLSQVLFQLFQKYVLLPTVLRNATTVLTCSESTRKDLISFYDVPLSRIHLISVGVDPSFSPSSNEKQVAERLRQLNVRQPFILNPSGVIPRKNQLMLVEAFAMLSNLSSIDTQLVIVGPSVPHYLSTVRRRIQQLHLDERILICPPLSDEDLLALYRAAALVVYPSLYEGAGLPVLEAMACGTPVIASNTSSLPELVGDAGLLVPPTNANAWANAMFSILLSKELAAELTNRGRLRASTFSWKQTVDALVYLLRGIVLTPPEV
jgi:glycosyltransferase involved in cell wall biosynthesis